MAENRLLPFAVTDTGLNLLTQAAYESDGDRFIGNQPGIARSMLVNKALKQATLVAAGVGEFLAAHAGEDDPDVVDTLTPAELAQMLVRTITALAGVEGGDGGDGDGPGGSITLPVGWLAMWPSETLPDDGKWMVRNGDLLSVEDYPELFAVLGRLYGGDGETTFALPDDRGLVERGWDMGRGIDYDDAIDEDGKVIPGEDGEPLPVLRKFGSEQGDAIRNIEGTTGGVYAAPSGVFITGSYAGGLKGGNYSLNRMLYDASLVVPTAPENRMKNRAYLPIIKVMP